MPWLYRVVPRDEEGSIVDLRLQQCTSLEVAARLGCSERTVRRIPKRGRNRLERTFQVRER